MKRLLLLGLDSHKREEICEQLCLCQRNDSKAHNVRLIATSEEIEEAASLLATQDAVLLLIDPDDQDFRAQIQKIYEQIKSSASLLSLESVARHLLVLSVRDSPKKSLISACLEEAQSRWNGRLEQEVQQIVAKQYKGTAIQERLDKLQRWIDQPLRFSVLKKCLSGQKDTQEECFADLFRLVTSISQTTSCHFSLQTTNYSNHLANNSELDPEHLSSKPPALHWTNWPRQDEAQLTWRFGQICTQMSDVRFQMLVLRCVEVAEQSQCPYTFRWRHGLLLRFEPVKVCLVRQENGDLEVSGRIDPAEMLEPEDTPSEQIWKSLGTYLRLVFEGFETLPRLPYQLHVVPIGSIFYGRATSGEHAFHLAQLLCVLEKEQSDTMTFREYLDDKVAENILHIKLLFPADRKMSCAARFLSVPDENEPFTGVHHRRRGSQGRRVSFGTISVEGSKIATLEHALPVKVKSPEEISDDVASDVVNDCWSEIFGEY